MCMMKKKRKAPVIENREKMLPTRRGGMGKVIFFSRGMEEGRRKEGNEKEKRNDSRKERKEKTVTEKSEGEECSSIRMSAWHGCAMKSYHACVPVTCHITCNMLAWHVCSVEKIVGRRRKAHL